MRCFLFSAPTVVFYSRCRWLLSIPGADGCFLFSAPTVVFYSRRRRLFLFSAPTVGFYSRHRECFCFLFSAPSVALQRPGSGGQRARRVAGAASRLAEEGAGGDSDAKRARRWQAATGIWGRWSQGRHREGHRGAVAKYFSAASHEAPPKAQVESGPKKLLKITCDNIFMANGHHMSASRRRRQAGKTAAEPPAFAA